MSPTSVLNRMNRIEFRQSPADITGRPNTGAMSLDQKAHHYVLFETAGGCCGIAWNSLGITRFQLPGSSPDATERHLRRRLPTVEAGTPTRQASEAIAAAKRYFEGDKIDFCDFHLDLGEQSAFFQQVYREVRQVRWGQTTTYGALARQLGAGREAARDVGQAMAKNPIPLIIPCHRVLAAGGTVGGFSAPGGPAAKIRMLELENVHLGLPSGQQSLRL
jgi:methylated-DNA-[protein]-cysteine S-methyltransferase